MGPSPSPFYKEAPESFGSAVLIIVLVIIVTLLVVTMQKIQMIMLMIILSSILALTNASISLRSCRNLGVSHRLALGHPQLADHEVWAGWLRLGWLKVP